jgi:hypothetical protein
MFPSVYGKTPGRPYDQVKANGAFPKMLYRAQRLKNGQYSAGEVFPNAMDYANPAEYERAMFFVETFNKSCQLIVHDSHALDAEIARGWRLTATEALDHVEALEQDIAQAAGEAAHAVARMSAKAQQEYAAASAATEHHVVDVVPTKETPTKTKAVTK